MATSKSKRKHDIPAVGYLRRSTGRQEKSLDEQRREIERYADRHNLNLIRWYQDDAISGDATSKRVGFQEMHKAACNGRDFEVILCWDQDRFGRFDSLEAGHWIHPLRCAGARLVTVTEGPIDWNDFTGRLMYNIKQEGKHQFLRDLSKNVTRGMIANAEKGHLCGQAAPYGYDRMLVDEQGNHHQRVRNGEQYAKSRAWHVTLVPSDDPEKVKIIKWLFQSYAETDIGLRSLANQLNRRGVPSPRGSKWHIGSIREMLKNTTYVGDFVWSKRRIGKYNRSAGGEIKERDISERGPDGEALTIRNDEAEWIVKRDVHKALISRKTFDVVQRKLTQRRSRGTTHKSKNGDRYILTGLLFCGHCRQKMYGRRKTQTKNGKTYIWENYECSTYNTQGKHGCGHYTVRQHLLLNFLIRTLRDAVLLGGHEDELRRRVREYYESREEADPAMLDSLRRRIADLDKDIKRGAKRLLRAPDNIADELGLELSNMKKERGRLAMELQESQQPQAFDLDAEVDATVERLHTLAEELDQANPARLRELIRRMVVRIELWWEKGKLGKRTVNRLSKGVIDLRPDPLFYKIVNRGERR